MGGFNQAQAHAQFVSDIVDFGLDVQEALEVGRFTKESFNGCDVNIEALVPKPRATASTALGHQVRTVQPRSGTFGYGQAVMSDGAGVHFAGSEPRHDGAAIPEAPRMRAANLPDAMTQVTPEERPQRDAISVADARGNFIDALMARFQQMHRAFHSQTLKIGQGRLTQHRVHAARERSLAGCDGFRRLVQGEAVREPRAGPPFESFHERIVVNQMIGQDIRGLRRPGVDDQVFRRHRGEFRALPPNEPERRDPCGSMPLRR